MKISNQTDVLERRFGYAAAVRMNCEAGFEAIDYTMYRDDMPVFGTERAHIIREMRSIADGYGVTFNQAHAPFPHWLAGEEHRAYNERMHASVLTAIEIAGALGVPAIIVHPAVLPGATPQAQLELNLELFADFIARGRACGVKIAIENMWGRHRDADRIVPNVCSLGAEHAAYIDAFHDPYVTACLDVGHSGLCGDTADGAVRALGHDRLTCLHLQDNDFFHDQHTLPFIGVGRINYPALLTALADIDYTGDLTFEADVFLHDIPDALVPDALLFNRRIGEYLRDQISQAMAHRG